MELENVKEKTNMFDCFEADVYVRPRILALSQICIHVHWGRDAVTRSLVFNRHRRDRTVDNTIQPYSHDTSKESDSDRLYNYRQIN